ncbi:MAG: glycosyltransferase [Pseudonocardia sp.]|uniref:glycosyltransferase n=1 Tax=unclassified Pseudonocardia TaxID=2619320 RepID=UPI000868ACAA|nr:MULTISPECIES: nucleotide disphospho-sugar-binding domain-containing protein [unclassified Pseudonocardia]MBN9110864.1 glycosyltransferase [Pseudonocardia sp.]ODU26839.1 MAG: glycosyltransferase [Pseudonocardia sp. SCN 72-51]ODV05439.1 MAG: glycosyltransferase [Pseudonocardia sp. SCN 73-27]
MSTFLVYTPPAAGHVFPLVPGLRALASRGHRVHVRTAPDLVDRLAGAGVLTGGIEASAIDPRITAHVAASDGPDGRGVDDLADLLARSRWEAEDLHACVDRLRPAALLVDGNTYGAATAAPTTGLPWAIVLPSVLPYPGAGIPPYGLGLRPRGGPLGAVRDAVLWKVVERAYGKALLPGLNDVRRAEGLPPLRSALEYVDGADRVLVLTGEPLEYPRTDLPAHIRIVGGQPWDPPADEPAWLAEPGAPWVLVTCSTHYQGDEALAATAVEALRDEPVRVLVTLADAYDTATLPQAPNVRVERFVPHAPVLARAAAVVCPSGMGIVAKSVAAGVPVVAVPFGRDQPEVARRVAQAGTGVVLPARKLAPARLRQAVRDAVALRDEARAVAATVAPADTAAGRFADAAGELVGLRDDRPAGRTCTV